MKKLLVILLMMSGLALGQSRQTNQAVNRSAEPKGGSVLLNEFIEANRRMPIRTLAKGVNGAVVVKGTVEPDGRMTALTVVKSIDSWADAEALRLLGLYRAWEPALQAGQAVRQEINYPVFFRSPPQPHFDPDSGLVYTYFDRDNQPTADAEGAKYRSVLPVDAWGVVRGATNYQQRRREGWETIATLSYETTEIKVPGTDSVVLFKTSTRSASDWESPWEELVRRPDGAVATLTAYPGGGKEAYLHKDFFANGMLHRSQTRRDSTTTTVTWYDSGLLHSVVDTHPSGGTLVRRAYDPQGANSLVDGKGEVALLTIAPTGRAFYEKGAVVRGRKDGTWTGRLQDGTLFFRETYDSGRFLSGTRLSPSGEVPYDSEYEVAPVFRGGVNRMNSFLGNNLRLSPSEIQKRKEGKLVVSFLVREDGKISSLLIEKSEGKVLDGEAVRVVKKMDGMWLPATYKGRPVERRYTLPIAFKTDSRVNVRMNR